MTQSIEQKYRKLSDVEHVLLRPARYIGSVKEHTALTFTIGPDKRMHRSELTWNPGFIKMFDEIITNSVDHSKRPEGRHLDTIKVDIDRATGRITIWDNGGIPVVKHKEYDEYVPTMIFGYLRSGSNFNDDDGTDDTGAGQNGEGSTLTNIFSTEFTVETCDGKKRLKQTWADNMMKVGKPSILTMAETGYTRISYIPDYKRLELEMTDANFAKLEKRVWDVAGCNPKLKVYLNGVRLQFKSFKDYVQLYADEFEYEETADWQVAVGRSDEGFKHVSFVNTTETLQGGTHIDYVGWQLIDAIRAFLVKKHKIDVKPNDIKQHLRLFINATIVRPRYDSQTKENLTTEIRDYKTTWAPTPKFIERILKSPIIESIVSWVEAKALQRDLEEQRKKSKDLNKVNPKRIEKLDDAALAGKEPLRCMIFVTEGDSARTPIINNRDPKTMGALALRGKPQNANSIPLKKLLGIDKKADDSNKKQEATEFANILIALGLTIGTKVTKLSELRYGKIVITSDADEDGHHIAGLLVSNLYKFWPELFELGAVYRFFTPIVKVWVKGKKEPIAFEKDTAYHAWLAVPGNQESVKQFKYYKGLGTSTDEDFAVYLSDPNAHMVKLTIDDARDGETINLVFGKEDGSSDKRKDWLKISADPIFPPEADTFDEDVA